jgi:ubiquinone/menaquinone biosynthesis C-methylase UbiE
MIRPGGEALTIKAIETAKLPEGARVLDVGCGEGDTVALLANQYGFDAVGVDTSSKLIVKGKKRHEGVDLRCMEAKMLDFESRTFDAVFMECSLSVFRLHEDAVFEAYCMLKPGGKLVVTDLYLKNPDPARVAEMIAEGREKISKPREENSCDVFEKPSFVMLDGAFVLNELASMVEEIGFIIEYFEDVEGALAGFAAQAIMGHGSLEEYFRAVVPEGADPSKFCACGALKDTKALGYFLMIMKKPE